MEVLQPDEAAVSHPSVFFARPADAFSLLQHTPLNAPGIYIRTLIPDGPAASDGRLKIGDRILAVNGTSLIGADYQRYRPQEWFTLLVAEGACNGRVSCGDAQYYPHLPL